MATNKKSSGSAQNKKTADSKKTNMKETSKVKRFFKYFFLTIVMLGLIGLVVGLGYIFAVIKTAPDLDVNSVLNLNQPSMLYDDAGEFIDNLPTQEERYVISYNEILAEKIEDDLLLRHDFPGIENITSDLIKTQKSYLNVVNNVLWKQLF